VRARLMELTGDTGTRLVVDGLQLLAPDSWTSHSSRC
jgi:hypothetical protein